MLTSFKINYFLRRLNIPSNVATAITTCTTAFIMAFSGSGLLKINGVATTLDIKPATPTKSLSIEL